MLHFIWVIIIGAIIGSIGGGIVGRDGYRRGCVADIVAGLVGSFIGQRFFGDWGPTLAGMAIFPSIIGAIIFVFVVSLIFGKKNKK